MEAAQVSINKWVDKTTVGHLHNGILLSHEKEENFTLCNSMDGPGEYYTKLEAQIPYDFTQRKTNTIWFHSYVKSNEQTELTSTIETDS